MNPDHFSALSPSESLEVPFDGHTSPFNTRAKVVDISLSLFFCQAFAGRMPSNIEDGCDVIQENGFSPSSIRSTRLAEFHNTAGMAWHPFLEASWTLISKQYLILLQLHGVVLPSSSMWTCDESKHLGSDAPSIKATLGLMPHLSKLHQCNLRVLLCLEWIRLLLL